MKKLGIWVEVTTLIVPGMNDDPAELNDIAAFIAETGREIPWHVSRFHPQYHMPDTPPTSTAILRTALEIGRKAGLRYVYAGNVPGDPAEDTHCYACDATLIEREGFYVRTNRLTAEGACPACATKIDGVFAA
jgi:pyruvate formate lyase activating enzyme